MQREEVSGGKREEVFKSIFFSDKDDFFCDTVLDDEPYLSYMDDVESYITAAFRSSRPNEVYLFMMNEYMLLQYAPGNLDDKVLNKVLDGPIHTRKGLGFRSLAPTRFAAWTIDCAFRSHQGNQAFIFCGNSCALIDYAPGRGKDKMLRGPMDVTRMFPFLEGTPFEHGPDAAFESLTIGEAYLFMGNQYAIINYGHDGCLISNNLTLDCLKNTIFQSGIDAAFASHNTGEAYLFKKDSYALINFADDRIIGGVKKLSVDWPSLNSVLPRKNHGPIVGELSDILYVDDGYKITLVDKYGNIILDDDDDDDEKRDDEDRDEDADELYCSRIDVISTSCMETVATNGGMRPEAE